MVYLFVIYHSKKKKKNIFLSSTELVWLRHKEYLDTFVCSQGLFEELMATILQKRKDVRTRCRLELRVSE